MTAGPLNPDVVPIALPMFGGVLTEPPFMLKHGLLVVGRQTPIAAPPELRSGNGAPERPVEGTGHDPAQAESLAVLKQASRFGFVVAVPRIWTMTELPAAPIGVA